MDHVAHVRFVDSHSECVRRHHDLLPIVDKVLLVFLPLQIGKSRMIPRNGITLLLQLFADFLYIFPRQAVDNAAVRLMLRKESPYSRKFVFRLLYRKFQIFPVKSCHQTYRVLQSQKCFDVIPYFFCRSRGKRSDHRPRGKLLNKLRDFQVARTEILAPLRNTVRLVHADHRDLHRLHGVQKLRR